MPGLHIQIIGPGCPLCNETADLVKRVCAEQGITATVGVVADFQQITDMGVFAPPGLVINGTIKSVGRVPGIDELLGLLKSSEARGEGSIFEKKSGKAHSID